MKQVTAQREQRFSDWQRGLTVTAKIDQPKDDVEARQDQLRGAVHGGSGMFAAYLRDQLGVPTDEALDAPALPRPLDPSEFRDPPFELEREAYDQWRGQVTPNLASQPLFWALCHIAWLEAGLLGERIDTAFLGTIGAGSPEKTQEAATRNLLRRIGGLPHERGKVSVLNDCPIARAWWRGRLGETSASAAHGMLDDELAHRVLHASNDAWARLVGDSVRRITAINHASVRGAVIWQYRGASRDNGGLDGKEMQSAIRLLARQGPALIFDALEWVELLESTADAVEQARQDRSRASAETDEEGPDSPAPPADDGTGRRFRRGVRRLRRRRD